MLASCREVDNFFLEENFNVEASDAAIVAGWRHTVGGPRVDSDNCYAAATSMQNILEERLVEALNAARPTLLAKELDSNAHDLLSRICFKAR
jgi:hypothetical protein